MNDKEIKDRIEKILDDCEDLDPDTMHTYVLKSKAVDEIFDLIVSLRQDNVGLLRHHLNTWTPKV